MEQKEILRKLQSVENTMLYDLSRLLKDNDIGFYLAYGTAIGCARHKGFIPWDDDVDIFILGEDYPRLQKLFKEKDTGYLKLHDYSTVSNYPYVFPKIIDSRTVLREKAFDHIHYEGGVYIDVFPLINLPQSKIRRSLFEKIRYFRYAAVKAAYVDASNYGRLKQIGISMCKTLFNPQKLQEKLFRMYIRKDTESTLYIEPLVFNLYMEKKWFEKIVYMDFEGNSMPMPSMYDEFLTSYYGDYMTPPPVEERVPVHTFSYLEFND